jgi:hypothetical protein
MHRRVERVGTLNRFGAYGLHSETGGIVFCSFLLSCMASHRLWGTVEYRDDKEVGYDPCVSSARFLLGNGTASFAAPLPPQDVPEPLRPWV